MSEKLCFSVEEARGLLGIGRNKLYDLIKGGELGSIKHVGRRLIPREALNEFIERQLEMKGAIDD